MTRKFWPLLRAFIIKDRKVMLQEEKWQELYLQERKITQSVLNTKYEKAEEKEYMNKIKTFNLRFSYFSSSFQSEVSREERLRKYEEWKVAKFHSVVALEQLATDHSPYLICSTCHLKISKLNNVGPITNQYFRDLFEHLPCNVQPLAYNELGDYFCSMLMTIYIEKEYDVYGCKNGHYLAIKLKDEKRLKILTFSPIAILYTDGSLEEEPEFEALEYKRWRERFEKSRVNKMKRAQENYCFVCGDKFKTVREVEEHIKDQYHEANMREFANTIPEAKRQNKCAGTLTEKL
jgi:hypothetical protein